MFSRNHRRGVAARGLREDENLGIVGKKRSRPLDPCRRDADDLTAAARRMPHSARCPRGKARAYCGRARPQRCCREGRCIVAQSFRPLDQRCWLGPARETRPMYVGGCTFWVQAPQRSGLGARATRFQTSPDSGERSSGVRGVKLSPWVPNHGDRRRYGATPVLARG